MKRLTLFIVFATALVGCANEDLTGPDRDATPDVAFDVATDITADVTPDPDVPEPTPDAPLPTPDAVEDSTPDATPDATEDAVEDATEDGGSDATEDAEPDVPLTPPEDCVGPTPAMDHGTPSSGDPIECPTCLGSSTPNWILYDFQPLSCGAGSHYGLDQFEGHPTMVVLLSAGCSYCLGQTVKLEELWWELTGAGHEFHFVVVNLNSMAGRQSNLTDRGSFAMFQDTEEIDAWGLHGGNKDDFYFYDAGGTLRAFYPARGSVETTLSEEQGYANIRDAMLHLLDEDVELPGGGDGTIPDGEEVP